MNQHAVNNILYEKTYGRYQETLVCYLDGRAFNRVIYYLENVLE